MAPQDSQNESISIDDCDTTTLTVKNFLFNIPSYYSEEGSKNEYLQYYAEKGDKVVMMAIAYPEETDDDYDVSFEGLEADNDNMIDVIASMTDDGDVVSSEEFVSDYGIKGILYHYTCRQKISIFKSIDASGYWFCFPSEDDRRWFHVMYIQTSNTESSEYKDDYTALLASIREKQ